MKTTGLLRTILFCLFLSQLGVLKAQEQDPAPKRQSRFEPNNAFLISPNYTFQVPFGKMAKRFGVNSLFGANLSFKVKYNWLLGAEGGFLYGTNVKEGYVLNNISTLNGQHITQNENLTNIHLQEQGFNLKFVFGKIITFSTNSPDGGLMLQTGLGYLQHKIAIAVKGSELPQLNSDYKRGYDRLTAGPVLSQFVGGLFLKRKNFFSLYAGLQFDVAFTKGQRNYDFYVMSPLKDNRVDMFLGVKVGWVIPIFLQTSEKEYYYY